MIKDEKHSVRRDLVVCIPISGLSTLADVRSQLDFREPEQRFSPSEGLVKERSIYLSVESDEQ